MNIIEPRMDYDFSKLQLGIPVSHLNSTYLARIFENNKPLYMQTPKCTTKGGIVKSGKKMYCDLMFSSDDSIFIDWVTNLEVKCQSLICNKSESWFQTTYSKDEIETAFSSALKIYRAGKYYLLRVNIKPTMKIYTDLNVEVSFDDINENTNILNIIEFYGIKFTSRNFQIELELKQMMIVSKDEFVDNCFIKPNNYHNEIPILSPPLILTKESPKVYQPIEPDEPYVSSDSQEKIEKPELVLEIKEEVIEPKSIELAEFDFDSMVERLEESTPLHLKRPTDQYYKEYNDVITRANKLKKELNRVYLEADAIKEKYSLDVDDVDKTIYSDVDISDNESESDNGDV